MYNRRKFLLSSLAASMGISLPASPAARQRDVGKPGMSSGPVIISTWEHGLAANEAAWKKLDAGGSVLDAVETGVMVSEADPGVSSVGYGGLPDSKGDVTLDASIMGPGGNAGAVAFLKHIMHPVSVARLVMEETPHVMLVGDGALDFALEKGFRRTNLLSPEAKKAWKQWKIQQKSALLLEAGHDTIGMVALDAGGDLAGACTTSGLAYKLPGRVGDSPIIGAGLFVGNGVGGAAATGNGELVMKILGSFLVVELMRNGADPEDACRTAIERIAEKIPLKSQHQVGFVALNKGGETGGFALRRTFQYAVMEKGMNRLITADALF